MKLFQIRNIWLAQKLKNKFKKSKTKSLKISKSTENKLSRQMELVFFAHPQLI